MSKIKVGYLLEMHLKENFKKKIISDSRYYTMSEAIDELSTDFIAEYNNGNTLKSNKKVFSGFEINISTKNSINNLVSNSYEFSSATDFINRVIFEYVYNH